LCLALFCTWTGQARAENTSLLVLPMKALGGIGEDSAALLTSALVTEAGRVPGYTVSSMREVEGLLSAEQARQMAACDSASCVVEVAGALNSDEVVLGQVGLVGSGLVWTLARVRARDGLQRARVVRTLPPGADAVILMALVPGMVKELLGHGSADQPSTAARPLRVAGGVGLGAGGAAAAVGLLSFAVAGGIWLVFQVAPGVSRGLRLGLPISLLVWGGTGGGAAVMLLGTVLAGVGAALLVGGFLLPRNDAGGAP
jgi:hypothetical protein